MANLSLEELSRHLISINSVSNEISNEKIADFLSEYLKDLGCKIIRDEYNSHLKDGSPAKKVNIVAVLGSSNDDFTSVPLALSGHMDTVPFKESNWKHKPLKFALVGSKYYGRGACDMKTAIAMYIKAAEEISITSLKKPLAIIISADEEIGCQGIRHLKKERPDILAIPNIVIGEPTSFCPMYMHKGYIYIIIELRGKKGGHSRDPEEGNNVIEEALIPLLRCLKSFKDILKTTIDNRFNPPYPTMNIGVLRTSDSAAKNKIANYLRMELDIRTIPEQDTKELFDILKLACSRAIDNPNISLSISFGRHPTSPFVSNEKSKLAQFASKLSGYTLGGVPFNTEAFAFTGKNCIIWGPGSIMQAHIPDEYIDAKFIIDPKYVNMYAEVIRNFCF